MNEEFRDIREILELIVIVKTLIKLQKQVSFSTASERQASAASIRLLDIISARLMGIRLVENSPRSQSESREEA